jgi:hypothetical protein
MYAKEVILDLSLKSLGAYVEGIANASPLTAMAIILSAGMEVKAKGGQTAIDFAVQPKGQGTAKIMCKASPRAAYEFHMSTDPTNAATWQRISSSTRGRIVKDGLVSGLRYYFRAAVINKNGQGPWSEVKSTIIL